MRLCSKKDKYSDPRIILWSRGTKLVGHCDICHLTDQQLSACVFIRAVFGISACLYASAETPQMVLPPQKVMEDVVQRPRADLNRDRWIQSPEC